MRLFWCAGTCDALGSQMSGLVLPLLLLSLGRTPAEVGAVAGVCAAATLLLGPFAAVPADRGARKKVMVGAALVSAAAMTGVALAVRSGTVPMAVLIGAVLVERSATSCYEAASLGTVALVCPPAEHRRVLSRLQAGERGALVLGPALGGLLFQAGRWLPFLADALSYVVAAGCIRALRTELSPPREQRPPAGPRRNWRAAAAEAGAGVALIRREPLLRLALGWLSAVNGLLAALYYTTVFALQDQGRGAAGPGLVLALAGAAGLAGALLAPRLAGRRSPTRVLVAVSWLMLPPAAALAAARDAWQFGLLFGLLCLLTPLATVALQARIIQVIPPGRQARTGTVLATASGAAAALAPALAGLAAGRVGPGTTLVGCAVLLAAVALHATWAAPALTRGTGEEPA
ncbi:putative MFS family arabinose efflux permease [Streptomyces sp. 2333.5]|uniref:MFS transporter n=1 Tax=unclassified Streptomyces TaxID=2593676 RepID=UPI000897EA08|nr:MULTISPECIES: MFS transporter [unclassified Streptomyces]PJJ00171.1 putative MFS family arabinose efflux permease [Streptomyces sp. 2333.5]SEC65625.1 Predicted arabinose efflux permease, MFS family [Streptomyces sp. 2112.2]